MTRSDGKEEPDWLKKIREVQAEKRKKLEEERKKANSDVFKKYGIKEKK